MFSLFFFFFASFVLQSTSSLHREGHSKAQYGDTQRSTFSATAALIRLNIAFLVGKKKKKGDIQGSQRAYGGPMGRRMTIRYARVVAILATSSGWKRKNTITTTVIPASTGFSRRGTCRRSSPMYSS